MMTPEAVIGALAALRAQLIAAVTQIDALAVLVDLAPDPEPVIEETPAERVCAACQSPKLKTVPTMGGHTQTLCLSCGAEQ